MRRLIFLLLPALLVAVGLAWLSSRLTPVHAQQGGSPSAIAENKGGTGEMFGPYGTPDPKWPAWAHPYPKPGYIWGSQGGIFAESADRIWFANRGEIKMPDGDPVSGRPIPSNFPGNWGFFYLQASVEPIANMGNTVVVADRNGKIIQSFTQWDSLFTWGRGPHSIYINPYDPQRHVYVVDDMRHAIYKFSHDGSKLVQTLGVQDIAADDNEDLTHFRRPTMMDFLPDGTFYVTDGYGNSRVVKFDKNGKPLLKWGSRGTGPGQFNTPHGIAVGGTPTKVFVCDRGNRRVQVFDENGKFLDMWPDIACHQILYSSDGHLFASDSQNDRIVKFDQSGRVEYAWGSFGTRPGQIWCAHQISADPEGNLYVAECFGGRAQKFVPKPGADPTKMVWGRPLIPMAGSSN